MNTIKSPQAQRVFCVLMSKAFNLYITITSFMKYFYLSLVLFFSSIQTINSQCALSPLSLSERVNKSTLIVEARVVSKQSYWNDNHDMIFTSHKIEISKVLKGSELINSSFINVTTTGGTVGLDAIKMEPELELEIGDIGIFLLINKSNVWVSESGPQGFVEIDKHTAIGHDIFNTYPENTIQASIQKLTGIEIKSVNPSITKIIISRKRAAPVITSFLPSTINAGTSSVLTIKGSDFGSVIDTNSVQFKDANFGGSKFIKALKNDYISWSDTMIELIVRTRAGTGQIRIDAGANGVVTSSNTLTVEFAHLNVIRGDTSGFETQEIGMNASNGITWMMNQDFYDSIGARSAFIRGLERWRCGTYINWDTLGLVSHSAIKPDGVNICAWDTNNNMPSGVLAQCFSYWSGCFTPNLKWYVNELDIRFRIKPTNSTNWEYSTANAANNEFHFESVATHELGHGHQLGHVINSSQVMHYSIANGQTKPDLSSNDIDAGDYVISKSASSICGKSIHSKLNAGNCAIVAPSADFTILSGSTICKGETVQFKDTSQGNISNYAWEFGINSSPSTANGKGPHNVTYSSGGSKSVKLTITTLNGNLSKTKNITVQNDTKMIPNFSFTAAEKGKVSFTNLSNNSSSDKWYFGDGDSSMTSNPNHQYASEGTYSIQLISSNTCNTDDTIRSIEIAWLDYGVLKNTACLLEPVEYIDSSKGNITSWTWNFSGGVPATANGKGPHKVSYNTPGAKNTSLTIGVNGSPNQTYSRANIVTIGTDTFSNANFTYSYYGKQIVGFVSTSTGSNLTYKWYFGDGDSSSEKNPIHTYTDANNKTVQLKISGDCFDSDTTIQLRDFTDLIEINEENKLIVSPNPAQNSFQIISNFDDEIFLTIYDFTGKALFTTHTQTGKTIELNSISSGTYIVKAESNTKIKSCIVVIN
ncbi:MAG: PKD domain-containing protein [Bacteroidia bacterium]